MVPDLNGIAIFSNRSLMSDEYSADKAVSLWKVCRYNTHQGLLPIEMQIAHDIWRITTQSLYTAHLVHFGFK